MSEANYLNHVHDMHNSDTEKFLFSLIPFDVTNCVREQMSEINNILIYVIISILQ